jgi:VWFA-related protein
MSASSRVRAPGGRRSLRVLTFFLLAGATLLAQRGGRGGAAPATQAGGRGDAPQRQGRPPDQDQVPQPTFRANVNAVQVDVRVVDKDGRFVSDLTADEFRVSEDNAPQTVTTFGLVDIPINADPGPTLAGVHVDPDVASNARSAEGRVYVIVMDDKVNKLGTNPANRDAPFLENTYLLRAPIYRELARDFVENHITDADRVAIVSTSGRKEMAQEFTNNRQRLIATINRFEMGFGAEPTRLEFAIPNARTPQDDTIGGGTMTIDSAHTAMYGLTALAKWLAQIPGRRKAIVMFSEKMVDGNFTTSAFNLALQSDEAEDFRRLVQETARANVGLYIVDPIGSPHGAGARGAFVDDSGDTGTGFGSQFDALRRDGLMSLSEATGAFAVTGSNDFTQGFERIVDENSSYYMLGYNSTNPRQDGKFRRLKVEVTRPGLTVRTRAGYFGKDTKPPKPEKVPSGVSATLAAVMASPLPVPGLTMSVSAPVFRGDKDLASVGVIVEARGQDLQFAPDGSRFRGAMEIVLAALDPDGKSKAAEKGTMRMGLTTETRDAIANNSVRLVSKLQLKPGRYQLRVSAGDVGSVGRLSGSVMYDLDVPDFAKAPLSMSGVALASAVLSRVPTTGTDRRWSPAFGAMPTSHREFTASDELRDYVEVYDSDRKTPHQVEVRTTIRDEAGVRVFSHLKTMTPQFGDKNEKTVTLPYTTSIPLRTLTAGGYVLSVEARNTANEAWVVERQVPFRIR